MNEYKIPVFFCNNKTKMKTLITSYEPPLFSFRLDPNSKVCHTLEIATDLLVFRQYISIGEIKDLRDKCTAALETAAYETINTNISQA